MAEEKNSQTTKPIDYGVLSAYILQNLTKFKSNIPETFSPVYTSFKELMKTPKRTWGGFKSNPGYERAQNELREKTGNVRTTLEKKLKEVDWRGILRIDREKSSIYEVISSIDHRCTVGVVDVPELRGDLCYTPYVTPSLKIVLDKNFQFSPPSVLLNSVRTLSPDKAYGLGFTQFQTKVETKSEEEGNKIFRPVMSHVPTIPVECLSASVGELLDDETLSSGATVVLTNFYNDTLLTSTIDFKPDKTQKVSIEYETRRKDLLIGEEEHIKKIVNTLTAFDVRKSQGMN